MAINKKAAIFAVAVVAVALIFVTLNTNNQSTTLENKYGIYFLDVENQKIKELLI